MFINDNIPISSETWDKARYQTPLSAWNFHYWNRKESKRRWCPHVSYGGNSGHPKSNAILNRDFWKFWQKKRPSEKCVEGGFNSSLIYEREKDTYSKKMLSIQCKTITACQQHTAMVPLSASWSLIFQSQKGDTSRSCRRMLMTHLVLLWIYLLSIE